MSPVCYSDLHSCSAGSHVLFFFFSSRRRHPRYIGDWSSDVCSSDLLPIRRPPPPCIRQCWPIATCPDRKSTRLNSSHRCISYAVFCLKKKIIESLTYETRFHSQRFWDIVVMRRS